MAILLNFDYRKKIAIGKFLSTHGLKGAIKLNPFVENFDDYFEKPLFTLLNNDEIEIKLKKKAFNNKHFVCFIENVHHIDEGKKFTNLIVYYQPKKNDKINLSEIQDFDVIHENKILGKIVDTGNYGSGEVFILEKNDLKGKKIQEVILFAEDKIESVNFKEKFLIIKAI